MRGNLAAYAAPLLLWLCAAPAWGAAGAARVLDGADHAELGAEIARDGVVRVALLGDRVERVIHVPEGFRVEHDPAKGDLYIHLPSEAGAEAEAEPFASLAPFEPFALFVGSERGFTYRLRLTPVLGGAAQLLIRNPATAARAAGRPQEAGDTRVAEIAALVRAVANREPLAGYRVEQAGEETLVADGVPIEIWHGPRRAAWLLALDGNGSAKTPDASALAQRFGPGVAAVWIDGDAAGGPLAVVVIDLKERSVADGC